MARSARGGYSDVLAVLGRLTSSVNEIARRQQPVNPANSSLDVVEENGEGEDERGAPPPDRAHYFIDTLHIAKHALGGLRAEFEDLCYEVETSRERLGVERAKEEIPLSYRCRVNDEPWTEWFYEPSLFKAQKEVLQSVFLDLDPEVVTIRYADPPEVVQFRRASKKEIKKWKKRGENGD